MRLHNQSQPSSAIGVTAARTEEDNGSEIGLHQAAGEGVAPSLLRRKGAKIIHENYWVSDGPARQKEEE